MEELDKCESLAKVLSPRFKLAVFKQRSVKNREDGCAIFYDTNIFSLDESLPVLNDDGLPTGEVETPISFVLLSGQAATDAVREGHELKLQALTYPRQDSRFLSLTERQELLENKSKSQEDQYQYNTCYAFTDQLSPLDKEFYDERVVCFAALRHKASNQIACFASTHLYHTQNKTRYENIRTAQVSQMTEAFNLFSKRYGLLSQPSIIAGDFNDPPRKRWSWDLVKSDPEALINRQRDVEKQTPCYTRMTQEYVDTFDNTSYAAFPTTVTLSRGCPLDYIFVRSNKRTYTPHNHLYNKPNLKFSLEPVLVQ